VWCTEKTDRSYRWWDTAVVIVNLHKVVWPALSLELNTGFSVLLKMPWDSWYHQELQSWDILVHFCGIFSPRVKRICCMMLSGGMTSVMGHTACTGVYCQNMNKWLWNAVFSDVSKFVSGQENGNLGESKNGGLELCDKCLEVPCSCGRGYATQSSVPQNLWVQQWI